MGYAITTSRIDSSELNENAAKSLMTVVVRLFIFLLIGDKLCVIVTFYMM